MGHVETADETVPLFYVTTIYKKKSEIIIQKIKSESLISFLLCNHDWSTPHLYSEGVGSFIDSGLDNLFCLSTNCGVDSVLLYQQALKAACLVFLENK